MKKINDYTKEDFLRLTSEERLRLINEESERQSNADMVFWQEEYPRMTFEAKAKYWAGGLFRNMRWQEESNQNPYAIYTEIWLKETLKTEPDFIEMLPAIYNIWGGMFDSGKVDKIIQKLSKKINIEK